MLAYLRVPMTLRAGGQAEQAFGELTGSNYFSVLEVRPALGRLFAADESSPVAVLSHKFWLRRFGADREIIGKPLRIGNSIFTIIGVAPPGFKGILVDWVEQPSLWVPLNHYRETVPAFHEFDILGSWTMESYQVVGRLVPGATRHQAEEEVAGSVARMRVDRPERFIAYPQDLAEYRDATLVALGTIQTRFWPGHRASLLSFLGLLGGVAMLILLIACFNVANLVLARVGREIGIRMALGTETRSVVIDVLGGVLGLVGAGLAAGALAALLLTRLIATLLYGLSPADPLVFCGSALVLLAAAFLAALVPALHAARINPATALRSE